MSTGPGSDSNTYNSDTSPLLASPSISLPKGGGAIRGIGEKFAANPVTGGGSMSVPIAISPGRSGFGPQLSISYDSGSGNGIFGFGWTLSLPVITRKTDKGLPQYFDSLESDVFLISGAEDLVPVYRQDFDGTWVASHPGYQRDSAGFWVRDQQGGLVVHEDELDGYRVRRYRPRIEGLFARIERWSKIGNFAEVHWRSISKDNVLSLYGFDATSRVTDPLDSSRIFSWLMCETWDDKGNAALYCHKAEDGLGVDLTNVYESNRGPISDPRRTANRYIKRILYGNRKSLLDPATGERPRFLTEAQKINADWMFEVVFDYGDHDPAAPKPVDDSVQDTSGLRKYPWSYRLDAFSSYRPGFEVRTTRLCQRVLMFHHFPDATDVGQDCLVRSTDFGYSENVDPVSVATPVYSFLKSVTQTGYRRNADGYDRRSLPAVEFEYSTPTVQTEVEEVDPASLENLPIGLDGAIYRWTDVHGEGIPGILTEQAGGWCYKRNLSPIANAARFAPVETVALKPNTALSGEAEFMDLAGDGQPDVVVMDGPIPGLYEHDDAEGWRPFRPFVSRLNVSVRDPNTRFLDLDGDGHADILITENDAFVWYPSLAEEGFGPARRVARALDEEEGPRIVFADGSESIYLADFSGDGLTDIVRVRNGEICYWPNLGYGRFGAKVTMDNAPWFDSPDQFDQKRIRLADIDGSSTIDIVYLHRDGVRLYFNQSGNGWSQEHPLTVFSRIDNLVAITSADLLGNGTACLVWSSPLPDDGQRSMRYVKLMGDCKPHLLIRTINNLGAETRVDYAPSTKFYLQDKYDGRPWITRLPFPVHVVERVETYDHINRNRFVSRHAYHHGYFDGEEREFRGFGMMEQWDTEQIAALSGGNLQASNIAAASNAPPIHTKTWFHTGVYFGRGRVSRHFEEEYFRESGLDLETARALLLDDTILPSGLTPEEEREACRALKGSMLRQEVYADDDQVGPTPAQIQRSHMPYTVTQQSFDIGVVQPRGANRHGVFYTHPREAINFHYERDPADPRTQHTFTLEVGEFGDVLKSANVAYGRRHADASLPTDDDRTRQALIHITFQENTVTNPITGLADHHRTPLPATSRTYEMRKPQQEQSTGGSTKLYRFDDLLSYAAQTGDGNHEIAYEDLAFARAQQAAANDPAEAGKYFRRLIESVSTQYRPDDCGVAGNDPLTLLPSGNLEPLALPGESCKLAFTPGLLDYVFQRPHQGQPNEPLLPTPASVLEGTSGDTGGYVYRDGGWWIPSGRSFLTTNPADSAATELAQGRQHFFLPQRYCDPFGQSTFVEFDANDLLMIETRDELGNRVTVKANDYRVLQQRLVSDANRNQTEVAFDTLGMVVGTATMGKPLPAPVEGDSLQGFVADLTPAQLEDFFAQPRQVNGANSETGAADIVQTLLSNATTRFIYDLDRYRNLGEPTFAATIVRETHVSELQKNQQSKLQMSFSYSDGFGREIQKKVQAESSRTSFADAVMQDQPVGYYRFAEPVGAPKALDSSGKGNHGAFSSSGITLQQPGLGAADTAALFDGQGSCRVVIPDDLALNPKRITIEALISWAGPVGATEQRLVEKSVDRGSPAHLTYGLSVLPDGSPRVELAIAGQANPVSVTGSMKIRPNISTHLAVTYDGSVLQIYVDGVPDASLAIAGEIKSAFGSSDIGIGNQVELDLAYHGVIDELALYDWALPAERFRIHIAALRPRWAGSSWIIFNNKGKPVRQYEPFFSATHRFEFGVTFGVSPVLFYDPAERAIATLYPNGTYAKAVFGPWQQTSYDVNDTCDARNAQTGDPRTDPDIGGNVAEYFKTQPTTWQTWYTQRIGRVLGADEQNAAERAGAHADTPTTAHFDALGRSFLTVASNRVVCPGHDLDGTEGSIDTRVELDIEGNQRAVRDAIQQNGDALGRIVMVYAYDMLGNRIHQESMEAGARWMLHDVAGKPIRTWDSRGHDFITSYDVLRRPVEQTVRGTTADSDPRTLNTDIVFDKIDYGEGLANAEALNLRTRIYRRFDTAGMLANARLDANGAPTEACDFKGNLLHVTRRLVTQYEEIPDWSQPAEAQLEGETFEASTRYDALNRAIQSIAPHSSLARAKCNVIQPAFNEANLLGGVDVWLERGSEPAGLLDSNTEAPSVAGVDLIDYDAKGQRSQIDYKNGASTLYEYDPLTFRLTHLLTRRGTAFSADCPKMQSADWPGCQAQNIQYTYDPAGNVTHIQDDAQQTIYFRNKRVEPSNDYTYDAVYRLIQASGREHLGQNANGDRNPPTPLDAYNSFHTRLDQPGDGNAMGTYIERYVYDAVGNFLAMQHRGSDPANPGWSRAYSYGETSLVEPGKYSNRLSRTLLNLNGSNPSPEPYQHDAHGNMTRMPHLGGGAAGPNMSWDYKDSLRSIDLGGGGTACYVYDATGQRVRKVWKKAAALIEERIYLVGFEIFRRHGGTIGPNTATLERETLHVMDGVKRIAMVETRTIDTAGADQAPRRLIRYQFGNHLGAAILELDEQAQIISYEEYAPYGGSTYQAVRSQTETAKRYRYTGKERDEESGFYYHGARYYAAWLGRWTACDSGGLRDGPNLYQMALDRPTALVDLNGKDAEGFPFALYAAEAGETGAALEAGVATGEGYGAAAGGADFAGAAGPMAAQAAAYFLTAQRWLRRSSSIAQFGTPWGMTTDEAFFPLAKEVRTQQFAKTGNAKVSGTSPEWLQQQRQIYADNLVADGVISQTEAADYVKSGNLAIPAKGNEGTFDTAERLRRGNLGEKLTAEALAADGHTILSYKPSILGTNQGGIDIVTIKDGTVYFIDNKALSRSGNVSSVSALTTNFAKNKDTVLRELNDALANAVSQQEKDVLQSAISAIGSGNYKKVVTNANLTEDDSILTGVTQTLKDKDIDFIDVFKPRKPDQ